MWNSSPWQESNTTRYWTKISKNEKEGHSDTSQGNPKAVRWKDRQDVYILTNTHAPPVEGNFTQESGQAIKPRAVEDYNAYMRFVDKSDRIVNSYGIARRTWQWTKELFFHLTDMTILNAFLIHKSCSGKMKHKNFCEILFRELIIHSQ